MLAHRVALAVAPDLLDVLVTLVGRDADHSALAVKTAHGFQHADRTHDVGVERTARVTVAGAHDRLRGEMQHEVGLGAAHGGIQRTGVADVSAHVIRKRLGNAGYCEIVGLSRRVERVAGDVGAELREP